MPDRREIWLTPYEMPAGVKDLFHFTFRTGGKFHHPKDDFTLRSNISRHYLVYSDIHEENGMSSIVF